MIVVVEGRGEVVIHSIEIAATTTAIAIVDTVESVRENCPIVLIRFCYDHTSNIGVAVRIESISQNSSMDIVEIIDRHWLVALILVLVVVGRRLLAVSVVVR